MMQTVWITNASIMEDESEREAEFERAGINSFIILLLWKNLREEVFSSAVQ